MNLVQGAADFGLGAFDMMWDLKCREEDLAYRAIEIERRLIDDSRRAVDEKAEQLKAMSGNSALIAGFAMVSMVEVNIPNSLDPYLLCAMGIVAALVVATALIAMLNSMFLLIAVFNFDYFNKQDEHFADFWARHCASDWQTAVKMFSVSIPLFLVMLALTAWVIFWEHSGRTYAASLVTGVAAFTLVFWTLRVYHKWKDFLAKGYKFRHPKSPASSRSGMTAAVGENANADGGEPSGTQTDTASARSGTTEVVQSPAYANGDTLRDPEPT